MSTSGEDWPMRGEADWASMARSAARAYRSASSEHESDLQRELLVFELDGSAYAIAVERVREIVRTRELTRVPRAPEWLMGVVALRGEIVEVVDLRRRLGLPPGRVGRTSRIIVLHGDADGITGVLVDSVDEVYRIGEEAIRPAQEIDASAVVEMCPRNGEFVSILAIDRALEVADG
ncbi:MAG: purine-binding chemotaxis protein CheW [Deltaproteobacteria bacterium]|jgi:purine-binding chemotaxis protein CheW|nr:purine-binding chemotaxis protein CheW [Deltaproteobacteria bacterium]